MWRTDAPKQVRPSPTGMPTRDFSERPHRAFAGHTRYWLAQLDAATGGTSAGATTGMIARAVAAHTTYATGQTRPTWQALQAATGLARRTISLHLAKLIEMGFLTRQERGRHCSGLEYLRHGRVRDAAVYQLCVPVTQQAGTPSPVDRCTPSVRSLVTTHLGKKTPYASARERPPQSGASAGEPRQHQRTGGRTAAKIHRTTLARRLIAGRARLSIGHESDRALASAIRQPAADGWTDQDFLALLDAMPLPIKINHPAGLLAHRIQAWYTEHGATPPTGLRQSLTQAHHDVLRQQQQARNAEHDRQRAAAVPMAESTAASAFSALRQRLPRRRG